MTACLRTIFLPKRDELTGDWKKLHNEKLRNLYSSPNLIRMTKSRRMRWAGHVARMGETRNAYRILMEKPEGKRSLGRSRRRWVDNIKMALGPTQAHNPWVPGAVSQGRDVKLSTDLDLAPTSSLVELYLHTPINLHVIVLNYLNAGRNLRHVRFS
jgi:hypothetical protein